MALSMTPNAIGAFWLAFDYPESLRSTITELESVLVYKLLIDITTISLSN